MQTFAGIDEALMKVDKIGKTRVKRGYLFSNMLYFNSHTYMECPF
jgi:hypothetical protein